MRARSPYEIKLGREYAKFVLPAGNHCMGPRNVNRDRHRTVRMRSFYYARYYTLYPEDADRYRLAGQRNLWDTRMLTEDEARALVFFTIEQFDPDPLKDDE